MSVVSKATMRLTGRSPAVRGSGSRTARSVNIGCLYCQSRLRAAAAPTPPRIEKSRRTMKFARLGESGSEIPVVIDGDRHLDLRPLTSDVDGGFLADDPVGRTSAALTAGLLPELEGAADLRIGAPIARPSAVICIGQNYAAHARESGAEPPTVPIMFLKTPNTVVGPDDAVTIPRGSEKTDWEVELGIVIGARAGYVVANDVSERAFQMEVSGGQWSKGKIAPGFNPTGPWLVTPDEVDVDDLRLRSWVNGEARQDSNTNDMIFDVRTIVHHLSQYVTLEPGD